MAEVAQLYEMNVGADNVYGDGATRANSTIMRVSGDDHMADPYLKNPVGDVPVMFMFMLLIGYIFYKKRLA